jgi:hypothetical protein
MCKHCELDELDDFNQIGYKKRALKIRQSRLGIEDLSISMGHHHGESKWSIQIEHGVTDTTLTVVDFFSMNMKIKYCPFCGEKLADRVVE